MDFWGCSSGVAGCSGTVVCVVKGSRSRCKEKRLCVPDYEKRTCSQRCNRCQMDFWGLLLWGCRCSGTAVCVVKGSWNRCKEKRFRVPDYENRTCSQRCSRCQMDFWGCFSGGAGCSGTAVCVVKGSRSRCKEKRFRVPDYENRTCSRCQMDFVAAPLGVQVFRNGGLCRQWQPEQMQRETALCARL